MSFKAYKAFNRDMTCRGFKYEEGETYELEGKPILCEHGFHFCKELVLTLAYYSADDIIDNCYAEVEVIGEVEFEKPTEHKGCTNKIKILRIIPDEEVKGMVDGKNNSGEQNSGNWNSGDWNSGNWNSGDWNSGDWNSGDWNSGDWNSGYRNSGNWNSGNWNSGDRNSGNRNSGNRNSGYRNSGNRNSGYRNSGDRNSGYRNSGDRNSGDWNSTDRETGFFNTKRPETVNVFNKPCNLEKWSRAYKPDFLYFTPDPGIGYKASFRKSWEDANEDDRERVRDLPNFDADIFYEISGIDLRQGESA